MMCLRTESGCVLGGGGFFFLLSSVLVAKGENAFDVTGFVQCDFVEVSNLEPVIFVQANGGADG